MTNQTEEVTVIHAETATSANSQDDEAVLMSAALSSSGVQRRMPIGASWEAPVMHGGGGKRTTTTGNGHHSEITPPREQEAEGKTTAAFTMADGDKDEEELVVAVGNAAKAARRLQQEKLHATTTTAVEGVVELKTDTETTEDDDAVVDIGGMKRNMKGSNITYCVNGYATYEVDDDDHDDSKVCYTNTNSNMDGTTRKKKNEICTLVNGGIPATTTDGVDVVVDDDDYVVGNYGEEEVRAYKTSGTATLSQSEHIQQQQQQQQGILYALISNVGLFLDQTWNWLYYFLVTIIFLNVVHFADRREFVVGEETKSVEVEGVTTTETEEESDENETEEEVDEVENCIASLSGEASGNVKVVTTINRTSDIEQNSLTLLEGIKCKNTKEIVMSPNTCSMQTSQEVEKAEEAIMAVGVTEPEQKTEASPAAPAETPVVTVVESEENTADETVISEDKMIQQQQITIVLPSDDQVVVVSGEDVSSSDDNSSENGLAALRRDSVDSYTSSEGSGNLGDIEGEICDKSSEDGTASSISGSVEDDCKPGDVAQKLISQVESMFSDEHLAKDGFLLKHVRRRSDGFVSLKLVAGLRKVKQISREFPTVLNALRDSTKLEINPEGTKVRRVDPLTSLLKSIPIKSKDKEKEPGCSKDSNGSSNDENQLPSVTIHQNNKSPSKTGNKENSNENGTNNKQGAGNQNRRNSQANQTRRASNATNATGNQNRRNSNAQPGGNPNHHPRKSSNTSTASSNNSSRHNSFSKAGGILSNGASQQHPADLFRNVCMAAYSSSGEECQSPQAGRRRGGSLPIAALHRASQNNGAYLSPNSSPPNGTLILGPNGARPKSNSYCEGASPTTMSPWLQRRKASASSRLSSGELSFSGVIRQPRGPDGTKGFATGYRAMILEERLQQQQNSAVSA